MSYDKFRNNSRELHSGAQTDGLAEFPVGQLQGVYIGVVKDVIYSSRNGHLKVYIPDFGGQPDDESSWRDVIYASPYMGRTLGDWPENTQATSADNTYTNAGQSYGLFMVPPDTGNEVICFFTVNRLEGYWFACLNSSKTRQMTPGHGAVRIDSVEPESIPDFLQPYIDPSWNLPVGETVVNYTLAEGYVDPAVALKPINPNLTLQYIIQGLISDINRGPISSSSQRDPISAVFGFSSPGRPVAGQDPALNEDLLNRIILGDFDPADLAVKNRYAGHSFIMDDGDLRGNNNLVRLRTAAGHQLIMHDNEGFIYVSNSAGTAWIELTAGGDICIYGANDLAIRSQGNIMMTSDRSISFDALENCNISAAKLNLNANYTTVIGFEEVDIYGSASRVSGDKGLILASGADMRVRAQNGLLLQAQRVITREGNPGGPVTAPDPIPVFYSADAILTDLIWFSQPDSLVSTNYKVPTHEPYIRGNFAKTTELTTQLNSAFTTDVNGNSISPPVEVSLTGIDQSENVVLSDQAPGEAFIKEPPANNAVGILDRDSVTALNAQSGYNASGGDYGYFDTTTSKMGKYGIGTDDLIKSGYLKDGVTNSSEALQNPNNWRGQDGVNNLNDFLASSATQDSVQLEKTQIAYAQLQALGIITPATPADQAAGLVNATLQSSPIEVANWATKGILPGGSTAIPEAYKRGVYSISQKQLVTDSNG